MFEFPVWEIIWLTLKFSFLLYDDWFGVDDGILMWREESGFLEMFLAYYSQFEENLTSQKAYRDFLMEVLCHHEMSFL